jgi:hypothetical protein
MIDVAELTAERGSIYGTPAVNHGRTAAMVRAWLGQDCSALDVCAMNILQKLSRLRHTPDHVDSWRDIAGYAANALEIIERQG